MLLNVQIEGELNRSIHSFRVIVPHPSKIPDQLHSHPNSGDEEQFHCGRHGGSLVDLPPFVRRVVGLNPALAAT